MPADDHYLIAGGGLAGAVLARTLRQMGRRATVLDAPAGPVPPASAVAAGLLTPVTGQRLAASWRWGDLWPVARSFYRDAERDARGTFFHEAPAVRLFASVAEADDFARRRERFPTLARLLEAGETPVGFRNPFGGFVMPTAARLDVPAFLRAQRAASGVVETTLDPRTDVRLVDGGVQLPRLGLSGRALIFCTGFTPEPNPYFPEVRVKPTAGQILTVRLASLSETRVVHGRGVWLAPRHGEPGVYRLGATYERETPTPRPTEAGRAELMAKLATLTDAPAEVLAHDAAVRPVVDAGRPTLALAAGGRLALFNGLGSKGALLAPHFAAELAGRL